MGVERRIVVWSAGLASAWALVVSACGGDDDAATGARNAASDGGSADGSLQATDGGGGSGDSGAPCQGAACVPPGAVCHSSGFCWENPTPSGESINAIAGTSPNDVWFVGGQDNVIHWDGQRLAPFPVPVTTYLADVEALDATHVWAVGGLGDIFFWNGTTWAAQKSGVEQYLSAVSAVTPSDVWAVGSNGTVLHFDGTTWKSVTTPSAYSGHLVGVYASSATDVWVVGTEGTLKKWDGGTSFVAETIDGDGGKPFGFGAIWGAGGKVWASTSTQPATIYVRQGTTWSAEATGIDTVLRSGFALDATHAFAGSSAQIP